MREEIAYREMEEEMAGEQEGGTVPQAGKPEPVG